ncbi:MAG: ribonuclease P protein subunit [Thermoplasmata archaeon]
MMLIGKECTIVDSTINSLLGLKGRILDETKNMIKMEVNNKRINVPKRCVNIMVNGNLIYGKDIVRRPVDRVYKR